MFDRDNNGTVDVLAFSKLFEYVNQWLNIFKTYDRNGSGQIDDQELNQGKRFRIATRLGIMKTPINPYFFIDDTFSILSNGIQFFATIHKAVDSQK